MRTPTSVARVPQMKLAALAVMSCFASAALANPTGGAPVAGTVTMSMPAPNVLEITNSPNSIIHWQGFSINAGEVTRFLQNSATSAVLNRVVTSSPSDILGTLQSNGRVFLINPNGIVFGGTAIVDVAGLVASTLNLTDADFLSGRMRFQEVPGAGTVDNQGSIFAAPGGQVYLVGPAVTNGGLINSPQGEVILAAGNSVELMNTGTPGLSVSITAPDNQALNVGQIFADSGRVGIFAGLVNQGGTISAGTAVFGEDGSIKLVATDSTTFAAGSNTFATGPLNIETGDLTVAGFVQSGLQTISATGALTVRGDAASSGQLSAFGGQTINAHAIDVVAQDGGTAFVMNGGSGDQVITVAGGGSSAGLDVRALSGGGVASISNNAFGATQTIGVTDADHIGVNGMGTGGASIFAIPGNQFVSITGTGANAINIGGTGAQGFSNVGASNQWMTAGAPGESGSITIVGSDGNQRLAGLVSQPGVGNAQTVSTSGTLSITGGGAPAQLTNFPAGIFHNGTGQQSVSAQDIVLHGGGIGTNNSVQIGANNGTQLVNAGGVSLIGGPAGSGNSAQLRANQGRQTIFADQVSLAAGAGGTNNFAIITAPGQSITVSGDLTITGGGSLGTPGIGGGARIGGRGGAAATPTDLALTAGGSVTLNGGTVAGAGAAIGSSTAGGQPTTITMNVGGDVTLNPGAVADAGTRIGSPAAGLAGGEIVVDADGTIALNSAGPGNAGVIRTADGVTLRASGITQGPDALIQANTLTIETQQGASLVGINNVNAFNAVNVWFGDVSLHNSSPLLTVTGVQNFGGAFALQQAGDVLVSGGVFSGPQTIDVTGGLIVQNQPGDFASLVASGGQTIQAQFVEVNALAGGGAGISSTGGVQRIETSGTNAAGEGLAVRTAGGSFAGIDSFMGEQHIEVRNADRAVIDGATGVAGVFNFEGVQSIALTGSGANALLLGSPGALAQAVIGGGAHQTVIAGNAGEQGSITLHGTAGGLGNTLIVSNPVAGGTQTVSTTGAITVFGGSAPSNTAAGIFANGVNGQQTVRAGSILLQGGNTGFGNSAFIGANNGSQLIEAGAGGITLLGGSGGGNNFVQINQQSSSPSATQTVLSAGEVLLQGGDAGTFNFAMIRSFGGHQWLDFGGTTLLAGASGIDNFAVIQGRSQDMTVHGDLALVARGSAGSPTIGGGARIGGVGGVAPSTTSLRLNVDGDFTMTSGSVAGTGTLLGNTPNFAGNTDIDVNVGGDVALNGGTAPNTFSTIGSRASNVAGGEIAISALGNIALSSSAPDAAAIIRTTDGVTLRAQQITQGPDARIEAGTLSVETAQGAALGGANSASELAMLNTNSGNIAFNNTSALLTVTGIEQVPAGALSLSQAGNLRINGDVASGAQNISASGDMTVTPGAGPNVTVQAHGAQTFNVGGRFSLLGGTAWNGYAQTLAQGPVSISTGGDLNVRGGSGLLAYALLHGSDDIRLTIGDELRIDGGSGLLAFARVQTNLWDKIFLEFPNRASGGYFVNGREGVTHQGLDGFFTGPAPARRSLIVTYGE